MAPFWIVISDVRGPASYPYRHTTQSSAIAESVRLCNEYGGVFFVMEAQIVTQKNDILVKRLHDDMEIPF